MKITVIGLVALLGFVLISSQGGVVSAQSDLAAPGNVAAQNTGSAGEVRISWDAVPNAAYYRIGWVAYSDVAPIIASSGDWLEHFAFIDIENRGQSEHVITRLTPGVQYAFIMASNDGRYGTPRWPAATGWAFLTLNEAPATHASLGSTAVNLTWNAVPGAAYYRIGWVVYADVAPIIAKGGDWLEHFAFIDIANRGQTEHTITRLTPGLLYAFIVAGNDGRYGTPQWPPATAWQFMTPSVVQPTGPEADRAALITLYNTTDGPNWTNRTGWLSDEPLEHWYGVTTDDDGRVTQLLLRENNLNGPIPAVVGNLTGLIWLDFQGNELTGNIPGTLGNLSNLDRLDLDHNQLTGQIPTQLRNLTNLRLMDLDNNRLDGPIPRWLGNMTGLEWLSIGSNPLGGSIPPELGNLTNLQVLGILDAHLTGTIPTELGNLSNLAELNLSSNDLTGVIPPELGRLTKLTYLSLRSNGLTGPIRSELGNMSSLESLYLFENRLSGTIPTELENLSNLRGLLLHDNQLSGSVPAWLGNLSRLRSLNLRINGFTGEIPTELGSLSNLTYLNLRSNGLTGPVPTELGNLSNLEQLYLYENKLSGEIPTELGQLSNLTHLNLRSNGLTGPVPTELGNLTKLEFLRLAGNQLTGCVPTALQNVADTDFGALGLPFCGATPGASTNDREALVALYNATGGANWTNRTNWLSDEPLDEWHGVTTDESGRVTEVDLRENGLNGRLPSELGNLTNLEELRLFENQLTGPVPSSLGNLTNLRWLNLRTNDFKGDIPSELGRLSNLTYLNLSQNELTGTIPEQLQSLRNLEYLSLWSNELTGRVPDWLGNLTKLEELRLYENQLSGEIPESLGRLSNLKVLFLQANQLKGTVPSSLGSLNNLTHLSLRSNKLNGALPSSLGNLSNLELMNLGSNGFSGEIPESLGNLSNLDLLYLFGNELTGPIPDSLGRLSNLTRLSLQNNLLTGDVPDALGNLTNLERIRLAGNSLTGCVPTALRGVADNDFGALGLPFCGAAQARQFSSKQLGTLFDEVISKTERREAFSAVKESNIGFSAIDDMKSLRSEFVAARTEPDLYYALVNLSNARRDAHLWVGLVNGGLPAPARPCVSAPIHVLPDYTDINNPTFFVAGLRQGRTSPGVGDVIVSVNGRSIVEYVDEITPWIPHSSLHGLYWRMAFGLPKQIPTTPPRLYSEALNLRLENSSGQRYDVSLPYSYGCYSMNSRHSNAGFVEVMQRENFNVLVDRNRQIVLLDWRDFELAELIQDIPALMEYAERERMLGYDMIIDVSWSSGGSGGAYAIQRLVDEPFRVTFGNVRLSDLGIERVQRYVDREPDTSAPDIVGLNLSRSWLYEWARTDATDAIRRGDEYTAPVPFKLAHLPKDSDGNLQPAPVHFSGEVAIINARVWSGSHLDQFMAMFVDNDLATFIGMPTGGFSNTWEGEEVLHMPESGQPLVRFMWSIGHTIRPNGEVLEGNPAEPDIYIPVTRDNFREYHQMLFDTALAALGR